MNNGYITQPNIKGQIVIPKAIREKIGMRANSPLHIIVRGNGAYITPIREVLGIIDTDTSYISILKKTRGAWKDIPIGWVKEHRRRELKASKKRKTPW